MEEKIITFTHAGGVKKASFATSDIQSFKTSIDKCLKGELHAITLTDDDGVDSIYPSLYLQNCHIEIKDKLVRHRNL
ncbi:hypothetical protein DRF62_02190 [Chryseobacterium piscium]|uniref:Uncharacterized protein n=1 Tax=Chryseobacterium piscium TaxID=333702 RepID=A0A3D9BTZ0_9FLAO|nr:hypothetical protein [Chryseobacterium piscium]REC56990.1 hypothetical protein DRF62_02190 [Chryseobacterium piscium]